MAGSRTFAVIDAATKQRVGTITMDKPVLPGQLVTMFRLDDFQLDPVPEAPPFTRGKGGVHDDRIKGKRTG